MAAAVAALLVSCAPNWTPSQLRAWDAFQDCRSVAPTATITRLPPQGGVLFTAHDATEIQNMSRCLSERHGYPTR